MAQFTGTERFAIQRRLGSGSFGVVYEAFDRERQMRVALKVPHEANATNIYLFKQEFRALADAAHPNLVHLFELMTHGEEWFFTMELVEGLNFYEQLCPGDTPERRGAAATPLPTLGTLFNQGVPREPTGDFGSGDPRPQPLDYHPPQDYAAVRGLLKQLAEGLFALHQMGKLHRDLKPTNVLVGQGGRLVLLDFGLSADLAAPSGEPYQAGRIAGTPAFMAPEQIGGHAPNEASDWYSVGVMLYQVLTGQLPFPGTSLASVINKMRLDPPAPGALVPQTPADLDALCMDLLARKPEARPSGSEILRRLGAPAQGEPSRPPAAPRVRTSSLLIGREPELATLTQAFETSQQGRPVMAFVHGASGMGKSYVLRRYLRDLQRQEPRAVVLVGRCYEQEALPYKALDSLVDALSQHLQSLPGPKAAALLPKHIQSLARLFPVLQQVEAVPQARSGAAAPPDPQELRRRAFKAMRELLAKLADRHPLVLVIEDLQWGDADSFSLLRSLFRAPDAPAMMVLATFRTEEGASSLVLKGLEERLAGEGVEVVDLPVLDLPLDQACKLATALLGAEYPDAAQAGARIAEEANGNPFYIGELSRHARSGLNTGPAPASNLDGYIQVRVASLPDAPRRLLETLALAGHPVEWEVLRAACGLEPGAGSEVLAVLRGGHLIRAKGAQRTLLETYHDRIRESLLRHVSPARARNLHLRLAQALEAAPDPDPQALAQHFQAAGDLDRAGDYALKAAEQALATLAFERAAGLFRRVLELKAPVGLEYLSLLMQLGEAQANAGLGLEAAQTFLKAVPGSTPSEALRLQRRASEEFFRCGQYDQGMASLKAVMATIGLRLGGSALRAVLSTLRSRLLLRLRGYGFRERREGQIPQADLDRIDICWAAAMGLGPIDHLRGGDFQARQLLLTLKAGEPFRIVRALAMETIYVACRGNRSLPATQRLQAATLALAERIGHPNPLSRAYTAAGTAALMQGRWKACVTLLQRAEGLMRENCTGLDYELHLAQHQALQGHLLMGHYREVEARLSGRLQVAVEKGDLLAVTNLRTSVAPYLILAQDDPARALRETQAAIQAWSKAGFHVQHLNALCALVNCYLYGGCLEDAHEAMAAQWRPLRRSMLLQVQVIRITCVELRARVALGLARKAGAGTRQGQILLRGIHKDIHALEQEETPYGEALALKLQAMEAMVRDRPEEAAALFFQAEIAFQSCDMALYAAVARRARGRLEGSAGAEPLESAERWMRSQGIANPARFAAMHLPNMDPRSE